jgi:hypothetical protein
MYKGEYGRRHNFSVDEVLGGIAMQLKVIYPDGTSGMVKASTIDGLIKAGKIIAFLCSEGWVEARRKSKSTFSGIDKRRATPISFFAGF